MKDENHVDPGKKAPTPAVRNPPSARASVPPPLPKKVTDEAVQGGSRPKVQDLPERNQDTNPGLGGTPGGRPDERDDAVPYLHAVEMAIRPEWIAMATKEDIKRGYGAVVLPDKDPNAPDPRAPVPAQDMTVPYLRAEELPNLSHLMNEFAARNAATSAATALPQESPLPSGATSSGSETPDASGLITLPMGTDAGQRIRGPSTQGSPAPKGSRAGGTQANARGGLDSASGRTVPTLPIVVAGLPPAPGSFMQEEPGTPMRTKRFDPNGIETKGPESPPPVAKDRLQNSSPVNVAAFLDNIESSLKPRDPREGLSPEKPRRFGWVHGLIALGTLLILAAIIRGILVSPRVDPRNGAPDASTLVAPHQAPFSSKVGISAARTAPVAPVASPEKSASQAPEMPTASAPTIASVPTTASAPSTAPLSVPAHPKEQPRIHDHERPRPVGPGSAPNTSDDTDRNSHANELFE